MSAVGGGHASVAQAIKEALEEKGHEAVYFDALPQILIPMYSIISRYLLPFYGFLFWTSNQKRASEIISKISNKMMEKKIEKRVKLVKPDFIISDHPLITKLPEEIFLKNGHVHLGVAVVDPITAHAIWFKGNPDVYFVPTKEVEQMVLSAGVPQEKVILTGYPIKKKFYEKPEKAVLRRYLGLEQDKFTIMLGGSSEGIGKIGKICEELALLGEQYKFQVVVVCGRNKSLFKKLAGIYYFDNRFKILGFERRMEDYLRVCDIVVSKAGPTNLYEAVASEKPFLAFSCMPGQEEGNLEIIRKEKIGMVEIKLEKIIKTLKKWIKEPKLLEEYRPNILKLKEKHRQASWKIVNYIENNC